jgi:Fur family ferric uptake transcriptional regulator
MTDTGEVIEFCDPRIQTIKKTIEEIFDIEITNHSLYLYGVKKNSKVEVTIEESIKRNNCKGCLPIKINYK